MKKSREKKKEPVLQTLDTLYFTDGTLQIMAKLCFFYCIESISIYLAIDLSI